MKSFRKGIKYQIVFMVILTLLVQITVYADELGGKRAHEVVEENAESELAPAPQEGIDLPEGKAVAIEDGETAELGESKKTESQNEDIREPEESKESTESDESAELNDVEAPENLGDPEPEVISRPEGFDIIEDIKESEEPADIRPEPLKIEEGSGPKIVDTITSVLMKDLNGNVIDENTEFPVEQGSEVLLFYTWEIRNDEEVNVGDCTKVKVPKAFSIFNTVSGDLVMASGESVGTFSLDIDGNLELVFNEYASKHSDVKGTIKFKTEFDKKLIKGENPVKMVFPISEEYSQTIEIRFKPESNFSPVEKTGKAKSKVNPDKITWIADVNKSLYKVDNAIVEDTLGDGLSLDRYSIKVYRLNVDLKGNTTLGAPVETDKYTVEELEGGFTVNLGNINSAYRIIYDTDIVEKAQTVFENKVKFDGSESTAKVAITKGKDIEKSGRANKGFNADKITWTINVNKSLSKVDSAIVEDVLETGLSLDESSIKVYKLTLDDNGNVKEKTEVESGYEVICDFDDPTKFAVKLGDIEDAHQIEYITYITDKEKTSFNNTAKFSEKEITATVYTKRGKLIAKTGKETIDYNEKYITWTIDVNTAEDEIKNVVVEDNFSDGLSLDKTLIKVYKLTIDDYGKVSKGEEVVNPTIEYTFDEATLTGFKLALGDINSAYRIVYRTDIIDDLQGGFTNKASIGDVEITFPIKPEIKNYFNKYSSYDGIDYFEKTMNWGITIDPKKEPIKGLVIEDSFPNGGLILLPDTLKIKKGKELVTEGAFTLEARQTKENGEQDWTKGFKIIFKEEIKDIQYSITYKTEFDPSLHTKISEKNIYINKASFAWSGSEDLIDKVADYTIKDIASDNGNKSGILYRTDKKIEWNIDVNYRSIPMKNLIVEDNLGKNQELIEDSIEVYSYTVKPSGGMKLGRKVDNTDNKVYTIEEATKEGFKLIFHGEINTPYRIVFKTKLIGKSQPEYTNIAAVGDMEYSSKVRYDDSEKFVEKKGRQVGDDIEWRITINRSLSEIENATLVDILSEGHELIEDSFSVYKGSDNIELPEDKYRVTVERPDLETGTQVFKLEFLEVINSIYIIEYKTKITAEVDYTKISNKVFFEGDGISTENEPFEEQIVVRVTTGEGTGSGKVGSLKIIKVDGDNPEIKLKGVEFELFDSRGKSKGTGKTNEEGILMIPRLKFGKYELKEIGTVLGYQILGGYNEILIESEEVKEITVANYRQEEPEEPKEPEEPTRPRKPRKPKEPSDPEKPKEPEEPADPEDTEPEESTVEIDNEPPLGGNDVDPPDSGDPLIDIDGKIPLGGIDVDPKRNTDVLPKTGEMNKMSFYLLGVALIWLGVITRRKVA